ncbi:MAG TPA: beta-propeller fold lactonase family protein [Terracidiphilus sp.]|nr:beta-propeller fold lactonase family protein [Terracidiphilus sp.]
MRRSYRLVLFVCLLAGGLMFGMMQAKAQSAQGAVFAMTNSASGNEIMSYARAENGTLQPAGAFSTGGNGSGGTIDPLRSQGSLTLSTDRSLIFAVNAGSGTVASLAVHGTSLELLNTKPTGGSMPTAVAQWGRLVYVLNAGGNGNVSGFRILGNGHLLAIQNSTRKLSGDNTGPTSLAFSPNGQFLVVTELTTNVIDVYRVLPNGRLSDAVVNPSAGGAPFAALFTPKGVLTVANASNNISSYKLNWNGSLTIISSQIPTQGAATCWSVILPDGSVVYTSNAGTNNLSGFTVAQNGVLTPLSGTVVGTNPAGSTNLDIALSADGRFLYTLNGGTGTIGFFAVQSDGTLLNNGVVEGLPASAGLNGIVAY